MPRGKVTYADLCQQSAVSFKKTQEGEFSPMLKKCTWSGEIVEGFNEFKVGRKTIKVPVLFIFHSEDQYNDEESECLVVPKSCVLHIKYDK